MSGASEARELVGRLRCFSWLAADAVNGFSTLNDAARKLIAEAANEIERLRALTAPSAGTGEGLAIYEECARIADDKAHNSAGLERKLTARAIANTIRARKAAAPSPSRREPTREEIARAIAVPMTGFTFNLLLDNQQAELLGAADAVLALLDRAGKE